MNNTLKQWLLFILGVGLAIEGISIVFTVNSSLRTAFGICAILIGGYFLGCLNIYVQWGAYIDDNKKEQK